MMIGVAQVIGMKPILRSVFSILPGDDWASALADFPGALPPLREQLDRAQALADEPVALPALADEDRRLLADRLRDLRGRFGALGLAARAYLGRFQVDVEDNLLARKHLTQVRILERAADITKVGVEMELVDSATGEQIAAMVDREPLGQGAVVASRNMSRGEKSAEARRAFEEWADRVRTFLNRSHELSGTDADRVVASYKPYGPSPATK